MHKIWEDFILIKAGGLVKRRIWNKVVEAVGKNEIIIIVSHDFYAD